MLPFHKNKVFTSQARVDGGETNTKKNPSEAWTCDAFVKREKERERERKKSKKEKAKEKPKGDTEQNPTPTYGPGLEQKERGRVEIAMMYTA